LTITKYLTRVQWRRKRERNLNLNKEQQKIVDEIIADLLTSGYQTLPWAPRKTFTRVIGGYAGTGKTTTISELRKAIYQRMPKVDVAIATLTGKAASVLKLKLGAYGSLFTQDYLGTIHGLIYSPETVWDKKLKTFVIVGWKRKPKDQMVADLIIIDEASMVGTDIWNDLKSYDKTIIAVGDHGQLPPVSESQFNLLSNPHYMLTEIHRQALNSPIIKLSKFVREEGYIPFGFLSKDVFKLRWKGDLCQKIWKNKLKFDEDDMTVLCAFNTTRANLNDSIRRHLKYKEKVPYPGEKIVCLVNNHHQKIMNGQVGKVLWLMPEQDGLYRVTLEIDGEIYEVMIAEKCFGEVQYTMYDKTSKLTKMKDYAFDQGFPTIGFFDYGYCISVHKSQGSEWDKVVVIEQRTKRWDDEYYKRWLYTAITRAREKLFIIGDFWG
jgi:ATP-dependent exoDNAse (exonuclease V) alpha subunit